mmetsp:Transcript_4684/g.13001  ORF Transcript_4684/g.13001 Transcript_4684/m.13001 type:complete len:291 (-) Transcript_4684:1152-2024(-)
MMTALEPSGRLQMFQRQCGQMTQSRAAMTAALGALGTQCPWNRKPKRPAAMTALGMLRRLEWPRQQKVERRAATTSGTLGSCAWPRQQKANRPAAMMALGTSRHLQRPQQQRQLTQQVGRGTAVMKALGTLRSRRKLNHCSKKWEPQLQRKELTTTTTALVTLRTLLWLMCPRQRQEEQSGGRALTAMTALAALRSCPVLLTKGTAMTDLGALRSRLRLCRRLLLPRARRRPAPPSLSRAAAPWCPLSTGFCCLSPALRGSGPHGRARRQGRLAPRALSAPIQQMLGVLC